jgi:hypothetical protein
MAASKTPKPPPGKANDPAGPESKIPGETSARPAGQIVHDERGKAVWKWGEDGTRSDSTSRVLRRLDVPAACFRMFVVGDKVTFRAA